MEDGGLIGVMRIGRQSSIEKEPRTLSMDQIHRAREAALYVMNSRSVEEALSIFTEGLEPVVVSVAKNRGKTMNSAEESQWDHSILHIPAEIKDIVSAPF